MKDEKQVAVVGCLRGDFIAVKLWGPRDEKVSTLFQKISPMAWQHIHFSGHYAFRDNYSPIDLEAMLAHIKLE